MPEKCFNHCGNKKGPCMLHTYVFAFNLHVIDFDSLDSHCKLSNQQWCELWHILLQTKLDVSNNLLRQVRIKNDQSKCSLSPSPNQNIQPGRLCLFPRIWFDFIECIITAKMKTLTKMMYGTSLWKLCL